jgi:ATP-binding cassette subfamily B protein
MFLLNWKLALIASIALPIVIFAINKFSHALKRFNVITRKKIATLNAYTQESLYGNSTIKLIRAEEQAFEKHNKLNEGYRNSQMKVVALDALLFAVIEGISSITIGLVLWYSLSDYFPTNTLTAGVMVAFVQLIQQLFDPLKQLGSTMAMLQGVFTSIDRIFGILVEDEFIEGSEDSTPNGDIQLRDVCYQYEENGVKVLNQVSFDVKSGESVAIVGSTGSGKSTIIKLLSKLYDSYEGSISIGGNELRKYTAEGIRNNIAIVPQDIVIFDGSVSFNIGLGIDGVTEKDIIRAAKLVGADKFIQELPGQYNHRILERGANLSHGQKQLLAFARALCKDPDFVILDEATSSVDPASEREIQQALLKILHNKTVIVIAHRLSTIKECDNIIVLEKGKILESGKHSELIANNGRYHELVSEFSGAAIS